MFVINEIARVRRPRRNGKTTKAHRLLRFPRYEGERFEKPAKIEELVAAPVHLLDPKKLLPGVPLVAACGARNYPDSILKTTAVKVRVTCAACQRAK